jgi:hypothetical protein
LLYGWFALWQVFLFPAAISDARRWIRPRCKLVDFISFVVRPFNLSDPFRTPAIVEVIFIVMMFIVPLLLIRSSLAPLQFKVTWVLYGLLASAYTAMIWITDTGFFRALSDFYLFGMLIVIGAASSIKWPVAIYSVGMWAYAFVFAVRLV